METKNSEKPIVYLLSTCPRCKRLKQVLDDLNADYEKVFVDLLPGLEKNTIVEKLRKHRPVISFPIIETGGKFIFAATATDVHEIFGGNQ